MTGKKQRTEDLLVPGGGGAVYESLNAAKGGRWFTYSLLSSIKLAIRDLASDQARSTERSDMPRQSAVSDVVKPAKYRHSKTRAC